MKTLEETLKNDDINLPEPITDETCIIGRSGILDSLAFVTFIVAVEQGINSEFKKKITLTNEKAFSRAKNPFRSVETLAEYIMNNL